MFLTSGFSEATWCLKHSLSIMAGGFTESCDSPQLLTFSGGLVTSHRPHSPVSCPQNISISPPGACVRTGGGAGLSHRWPCFMPLYREGKGMDSSSAAGSVQVPPPVGWPPSWRDLTCGDSPSGPGRFAAFQQVLLVIVVKRGSHFFPTSETCSLNLIGG